MWNFMLACMNSFLIVLLTYPIAHAKPRIRDQRALFFH